MVILLILGICLIGALLTFQVMLDDRRTALRKDEDKRRGSL